MSPFKEAIDTYSDLQFTKPGFALWFFSVDNDIWVKIHDALDKSEKFRCLTLGRTGNAIHTRSVVQGGGGAWNPPPRNFWYVAVFWNDFTFSWKPLILLTRWGIFYGWWRCWRPVTSPTMVAILVLPRIRNQVTTARNGNFLFLTWKITHK